MVPSLNPFVGRAPDQPAPPPANGGLSDRACRRIALVLGALSVAFHLAYLASDCPLDLSPDEAHYWQWSRHLDWSYYSKGPLVAWLIRASCELFGAFSEAHTGSLMFAVRLPAVLCHAALLAGWYVLAALTLKSHRAALATVAVALTVPAVTAGAILMTIDPPYLACWVWATVGVWKALESGRRKWWLFAGAASALGILAKYPMALLPAATFGYLLVWRRAELKRPGFWLFAGVAALGLVPVFAWNAANGWVTFKHVGTQAVGTSGSGVRWFGPIAFAGGQAAFLIGVWFVVWACAVWAHRRTADPARAFLWWGSVPVWGLFAVASFKASGQVNWPAAAYVTGFVLSVAWVRDRLTGPNPALVARVVSCGAAVGLALSALVHFPGLMRGALAQLGGAPTETNPTPVRKFDPTARLRGWRALAAEVDALRARVRAETGEDPLVAGTVWNVPGALGVYCAGHPETYSFGSAMGDRHSQYDVWRPNPVADAQAFRGRTFVVVGDGPPPGTFERLELGTRFVYRESGVPVAVWWVWIGHGFRGFPERPTPNARY